jgi:hypothetical protein
MPPNDALGAIQLQPPNGSTWDYRPGKNNSGGQFVTKVPHPSFDNKQWSRCEILGRKATGQLRMACCQPIPCKGVEVVRFTDPTAARSGPIGLQVHNSGLHDEYKDISIEENPTVNDLITTK